MSRGMSWTREGTLLWPQRMKRMAKEGPGQDRRQKPAKTLAVLRQVGKPCWHVSSGSARGTEAPLKREFRGDRLAEAEGGRKMGQAGNGEHWGRPGNTGVGRAGSLREKLLASLPQQCC